MVSGDNRIHVAFGKKDTIDWSGSRPTVLHLKKSDFSLFSPDSRSIPEIENESDLEVLRRIYEKSVPLLEDRSPSSYSTRYVREFDMTTDKDRYSVGGGGRYDGLVKSLGSESDVPAIGFALNIDTLLQTARDTF